MPDKRKVDLRLDWATHEAARYACENWHYSKCVPAAKLVKIGVWENKTFVGCLIFSRGATDALVKPYGLEKTEGVELTRIAMRAHESYVSRVLSIAVKMLKIKFPDIRLLVSFADMEQGHVGGIYKASNWVYTGMSNSANEYIVFGKRMHGRSFRAKYGKLKNKPKFHEVKGSRKYRYLMPLDNEMRDRIAPLSKPYPKRDKQAMTDDQSEQRQGSTDRHAPELETT